MAPLRWLRELGRRLGMLLRRRQFDHDLEQEMYLHRELKERELIEAGMSPEEAHYAAQRQFGNTTLLQEDSRAAWGWNWLEQLAQDVRYGVRMLRKSPGFTAVVVLTLALGIGANTAIFTLVNTVMLRPLPYRSAERLIMVWATDARRGVSHDVTSYPNFTDWERSNHSFERLAAFTNRTFNLTGGDAPERVTGLRASEGLLPMLGVAPARGRSFLPEDYRAGAAHVVLLGDGLWRRRFGADAKVVGRAVKINDELYTVVGILPASFAFPPEERSDLCLPLLSDPERNHGFLMVLGLLKAGIPLRVARDDMESIAQRLEREYPGANKGAGVNLVPLQESAARNVRTPLLVFLGAVTFVLLIACVNVANLLLARGATRQSEFAVRAALGASRLRVARQLLTEGALLAIAGGALGLFLAVQGTDVLLRTLRHNGLSSPLLDRVGIDARVLAFTLSVSLLTGLAFSLAPALGAAKLGTNNALKESGRGVAGTRMGLRRFLVIAELALSLVLLAGAGLMLKSFLLLEQVSPGVQPKNVLTMDLPLLSAKYSKPTARDALLARTLEQIASLPGVRSAGLVADLPFSGSEDGVSFRIEGVPDLPSGELRSIGVNVVSPNYFRTMGIRLRNGREFAPGDGREAPLSVVINEAAVRLFWPGENPIGRRITLSGDSKNPDWYTIVGIVADVRDLGLESEPRAEAYVNYAQDPYLWTYTTLVVRTDGDPLQLSRSVRDAVRAVDSDLPVANIKTMEQVLSASVAQPRLSTFLLSIFGGVALLLAAIGLYGVTSYSVEQRTHEIGIRIALGAQRKDVGRMVLGQGVGMALVGVAIGFAAALGLTRLMVGMLFGVSATDPFTFAGVAILLMLVALAACYIPARRAMRVDPMVALRYE